MLIVGGEMGRIENLQVFQFKITLRDVSSPIWRRVQVKEDCTLDQLHRVLQLMMGWESYHLYEFRIGRARYGDPDPVDAPATLNAKRTRLRNVLSAVGAEFEYVYDFADFWQHDLIFESVLVGSPDLFYLRCVAGERSCPPEDVGGSGGYQEYLEVMADPSHEEHENMMIWRGPFDPEEFSVEKVNKLLEKKFRPLCT